MTRCRAEIQTYHLSGDERMRYVLSYGRRTELLQHINKYQNTKINKYQNILGEINLLSIVPEAQQHFHANGVFLTGTNYPFFLRCLKW